MFRRVFISGTNIETSLFGKFTLSGHQVPNKVTLSLPSSTAQRKENRMKGSWVEIKTGRDHSPFTVMGKRVSAWGVNLVYCQSKSEKGREKKTKS